MSSSNITSPRRRSLLAFVGVASVASGLSTAASAESEPLDTLWANYQSRVAAQEAALDAYQSAEAAVGYEGARELDEAADEAVSAKYDALDLIDQTPARTVRGAIIKLKSVHARASFNAGFNDGLGGYEFEIEAHKVAAVIAELEALSGGWAMPASAR